MPGDDLFLKTIEAAYASGVEDDRLPEALTALNQLLDGAGAVLEVVDKRELRHSAFCSVGLPDLGRVPYIEQFAAINPRMPYSLRLRQGELIWDYQILDENGMKRSPFYAEFLKSVDLRYCLGAVIEQTPESFAALSIQRTKKQSHVDKREIALMGRLYPHFQRSYDLAKRLKVAERRWTVLENAFDWVAEGVALLRPDGKIVFANDTLRDLANRGDGIRLLGSSVEFIDADARRSFSAALGTTVRLGETSYDALPVDFPAARSGGVPAYIVSVRPLMRGGAYRYAHEEATVMVFIRDPLWRNATTSRILQDQFDLTNAEAHLAHALCTGTTTTDYARERRVSLNTVYSHLKRIREKTGCKSVPELILKFGELNVPLRPIGPSDSA